MTEYAVTIRISPHDFEHLSAMSSNRANFGLEESPDRFRDYAAGRVPSAAELGKWAYAYWYDDYPHVILARSFLEAIGEPFLVTSDEYVEPGEEAHGIMHHTHGADWVIFTDYADPGWVRREEQGR